MEFSSHVEENFSEQSGSHDTAKCHASAHENLDTCFLSTPSSNVHQTTSQDENLNYTLPLPADVVSPPGAPHMLSRTSNENCNTREVASCPLDNFATLHVPPLSATETASLASPPDSCTPHLPVGTDQVMAPPSASLGAPFSSNEHLNALPPSSSPAAIHPSAFQPSDEDSNDLTYNTDEEEQQEVVLFPSAETLTLHNKQNTSASLIFPSLVTLLSAYSTHAPLARRQSSNAIDAQLEIHFNRPLYGGRHFLHHAVASKDYTGIALILKSRHRDTINEQDALGRTPLHIALLAADVVAVQLLLALPVLPSIHDTLLPDDEQQLHEADDDDEFLAAQLTAAMDSVDFPDLGIFFNGLPTLHLPLAAVATVDANSLRTSDVIQIYTFLLGYAELARTLLRDLPHHVPQSLPETTFTTACGWAPRYSTAKHPDAYGRREGVKHFLDFLESRYDPAEVTEDLRAFWSIDAVDEQGSSALHRACSFGAAAVVEALLNAGANPLLKDSRGYLPVHRAIDSGDEETFSVLLRRKGAVVPLDGTGLSSCSPPLLAATDAAFKMETGCNPWNEDTSIVALFKHCILRGAWRCLGRLVTDVVYSQFPISESDFDQLVDFAQLCGYHEEFSEAFKTAVDGSIPLCNGSWQADHTRLKIFSHDACFDHIPLPHGGDLNAMKKFKLFFKYPENPSRLHCLTSKTSGILRSISFQNVPWDMHPPPATMADILRVHDWTYVHHILSILRPFTPHCVVVLRRKEFSTPLLGVQPSGGTLAAVHESSNTRPVANPTLVELDADTALTPKSWEASCRAAGAAIAAVRAVCLGETKTAFCAVRPPGHHLGTFGPCQPPTTADTAIPGLMNANDATSSWPVHETPDEEDWLHGSQGFCVLNNVAIAAAYARYHFADKGIRRIAIIDFDIHHGNGTEQIVLNLKPRERKFTFFPRKARSDFALSIGYSTQYWKPWLDDTDSNEVFFGSIHGYGERFYPNTGGQESRFSHPTIRNVPLPPRVNSEEFRIAFKERLLNPLAAFRPDLLLLSSGFDGHQRDLVNDTFAPCSEWDFQWLTRFLVAVANETCNGRIVSILEGGYNCKAGALSPLAQSVAHHVLALLQTPPSFSLLAARMLDERAQLGSRLLTETQSDFYNVVEQPRRRRKRAAAMRALAVLSEQEKKQCPQQNTIKEQRVEDVLVAK